MNSPNSPENLPPLLDERGALTHPGWSAQPNFDCNLEQARSTPLRFLQRLRLKQWDYYGLMTPEYFFSFTLADIGYAGSVFAYAIEWASGRREEATLTLPLAQGVRLPRNSTSGTAAFANGQVELEFTTIGPERRIQMEWKDFGGRGKPAFTADVRLHAAPGHESLNLAIPIAPGKFYYNRKINCLPAEGVVSYQGKTYPITPHECLGNLDWGRGVWAYNSHWVWASASDFLPGGRMLGLNMGYGFGGAGAPSEHAVILDGKVEKLERVDFAFNPKDYMAPWRMTSPDGRLDLAFTPVLERVARTDMKLVVTEVHQMFGVYNGRFTAQNGEQIQIEGLRGFAEEHYARW